MNKKEWEDLLGPNSDFGKVLPEICTHSARSPRFKDGRYLDLGDPILLKQFCSLPHGERITKIISILKCRSTFKLTFGDQKNEAASIKLREEGNNLMKRKILDLALAKYTESISVAPVKSANISFAFANRAAVLKLMGHWQASITESQRARDYGYPENLQYKLLTRIAQCYQQMGQSELAITNYQIALQHMAKSNLEKEDLDKLTEMIDTDIVKCGENQQAVIPLGQEKSKKDPPPIPKLSYGINPEVPSASVCIGLRYSDKYGRHFVATRDIKPGDVLIVEKPSATFLFREKQRSHCSHCFKTCRNLLPCPTCAWTMYCSTSCLESAQSYHTWECKVITPEFLRDFKVRDVRSVNILAKYGLDNWVTYLDSQEDAELNTVEEKRTQGFNSEGKYVSSDPNVTYNLSGNLDIKPKDANQNIIMLRDSITVAKMLIYLHLDDHPGVKGLASLLYKMKCTAGVDTIAEFHQHRSMYDHVGIGVFGTFYLLSHNCDPNSTNCFFGNTIVVRSQRTIPEGSQIFVSYGRNYRFFPKEVRQNALKELCGITCDCEACEQNWPTLENIPDIVSVTLPQDQKFLTTYHQCKSYLDEKIFFPGAKEMIVTKEILPMVLKQIAVMDRYNKRFCRDHVNMMECVRSYFARVGYQYTAQLL